MDVLGAARAAGMEIELDEGTLTLRMSGMRWRTGVGRMAGGIGTARRVRASSYDWLLTRLRTPGESSEDPGTAERPGERAHTSQLPPTAAEAPNHCLRRWWPSEFR